MRSGLLHLNNGRFGVIGIVALMMLSCGEDAPPKPVPDPPAFRVGGMIAGLSGSLTLQLNGMESLTRSENGAFTFQSPLADESAFTVALTATPTEQDCTLQGATGKVNGTNVDSVRVTCTQRTYSLGGTVEGLNGTLLLRIEGGETLSITANGPFTFQTRLPTGGTYAVTVATQPRGHECAVNFGSGTVAGNVTGITVQCMPWFELTTFQTATVVIGQNDFTSSLPSQGGAPGPATLEGPWGNPVFAGGRLYVSDLFINRILGFNGLPSQNGASANFVLGQPDFTSGTERSGREGLSGPEGLSTDGTRLAVADKSNSRILIFNTLPTGIATEPDLVIGQPDFTSTTSSECDRDSLSIPEDVSISHGKLVVADSANSRVLIWNTLPISNGVPADLVLGQTSFTTCTGNDANGDGTRDAAPTASTLFYPGGVWTDGTRLLVADTDNNRVLLWNQFPTTNGQPADVVLGQPDFTTRGAALTSSGMEAPYNVTSTGRQIFAAELVNNRVLVWNRIPTVSDNGIAADVVLGQPDFTSRNRGDPASGTTPSARSLYRPSGILLAWPYLGVVDYGNNRLLLFQSP